MKKYAFVYGIALAILLFAILYATVNDDIGYAGVFQDPLAVIDGYPLAGFISNVGTLIWTIASTIALFCHFLLAKNGNSSLAVKFLKWMGLLTSIFLLDDLFMLHETKRTPLPGIPEEAWYVAYFVSLLLILYFFRRLFVSQNPTLLFIAISLFGLSIITDVLLSHIPLFGILEDIFKFFGVVSWATFLVDISVNEFQNFINKTRLN